MPRTIIIDANVVDQINRGNGAAATTLRGMLRNGDRVYVSRQAYNELVRDPQIPRTRIANKLFLEKAGVKIAPPGLMKDRVAGYAGNPVKSGASEKDVMHVGQARAIKAEVWSFDRVFRKNTKDIEQKTGIKIAPESTRVAHTAAKKDYRVGRKLMGWPPVQISLNGRITRSRPLGSPPGSTGSPPRSGGAPPSGGSSPPKGASTKAYTGVANTKPIVVGGPSARGVAKGAGIQLAFMGANFVLNLINDHIQQKKIQKALAAKEASIQQHLTVTPTHGVLIILHLNQIKAPPDSLMKPGPVFSYLETRYGQTLDEARKNQPSSYWPGTRSGQSHIKQEVWIPPKQKPLTVNLRTPFPMVAVATFAPGKAKVQGVEWSGKLGFDDGSHHKLSVPQGADVQMVVLRPPASITFPNGRWRHEESLPLVMRKTSDGTNIEVVDLDPVLPWNVTAAMVFPANEATARLFRGTRTTKDNLRQLRFYTNFSRVRWVRPENLKILRKL